MLRAAPSGPLVLSSVGDAFVGDGELTERQGPGQLAGSGAVLSVTAISILCVRSSGTILSVDGKPIPGLSESTRKKIVGAALASVAAMMLMVTSRLIRLD